MSHAGQISISQFRSDFDTTECTKGMFSGLASGEGLS
jgi:hypothetical protein